jgi:2-methylcitrate dehydratase PrpD
LGAIASPTSFEGDGGFYHLFGGVERDALHDHDVRADVMSRLGSAWGLPELIYKPYPVNYFNEVFADGALVLRNRHQLTGSDVAAVRITVGQLAATSGAMVPPPYVTRGGHLGSTRFCVASMLSRGTLSLADTQDLGASDIGAIMEVTEVIADPGLVTAAVEVTTKQGDVYVFDGATEGREYTLDEDEIREIFRATAVTSLGEEGMNALLDALADMESAPDLNGIMRLSVRPGVTR